jgi:hypothetical protein
MRSSRHYEPGSAHVHTRPRAVLYRDYASDRLSSVTSNNYQSREHNKIPLPSSYRAATGPSPSRAEYNACGRPVYFVRDDWYQREYVPRYQLQMMVAFSQQTLCFDEINAFGSRSLGF